MPELIFFFPRRNRITFPVIRCRKRQKNRDVNTIYLQNIFKIEIAYIILFAATPGFRRGAPMEFEQEICESYSGTAGKIDGTNKGARECQLEHTE